MLYTAIRHFVCLHLHTDLNIVSICIMTEAANMHSPLSVINGLYMTLFSFIITKNKKKIDKNIKSGAHFYHYCCLCIDVMMITMLMMMTTTMTMMMKKMMMMTMVMVMSMIEQ